MTYVKIRKMKKILIFLSIICSTWNIFGQLPVNTKSSTFWVNDTLINLWLPHHSGGSTLDTTKFVTKYDLNSGALNVGMIVTGRSVFNSTSAQTNLVINPDYISSSGYSANLDTSTIVTLDSDSYKILFNNGIKSEYFNFTPNGLITSNNKFNSNPYSIPNLNNIDSLINLHTFSYPASGVVTSTGSAFGSSLQASYTDAGGYLAQRDANGNCEFNNVSSASSKYTASNQTITMNFGNTKIAQIVGTNNINFNLPDATYLIDGQQYEFNNDVTAGTVSIKNTSGTAITTCPPGGYTIAVCTNNTTANGVWDSYNYLADNTQSGNSGISYAYNLAAENTGNARWLPDKNYVDSSLLLKLPLTGGTLTGKAFYSADFAKSYTSRSLIDKNYSDSLNVFNKFIFANNNGNLGFSTTTGVNFPFKHITTGADNIVFGGDNSNGPNATTLTTGSQNIILGLSSLYSITSGNYNIGLGAGTLGAVTTASNDIAIGNYAGFNESRSNRFYVNDFMQTSLQQDTTLSLLYGTMGLTVSSQQLTINGYTHLNQISSYGANYANSYTSRSLPDKNYVDSAITVHSGPTAILNGQSIQLSEVLLKNGVGSETDSLQGFTIHLPSNGTYLLSYTVTVVSNSYVLASLNPFTLTFGTTFVASEGNSPTLTTLLPSSSNFNSPVYSSSFLYTNTSGSVKIKLYGFLGTAPTSGNLSVAGQFLYVLL